VPQHCFRAFCERRLSPLHLASASDPGSMERAVAQRLKAVSAIAGLQRLIGNAGGDELAGEFVRSPVLRSHGKEPPVLKGRFGDPITDAVRGSRLLEGICQNLDHFGSTASTCWRAAFPAWPIRIMLL